MLYYVLHVQISTATQQMADASTKLLKLLNRFVCSRLLQTAVRKQAQMYLVNDLQLALTDVSARDGTCGHVT